MTICHVSTLYNPKAQVDQDWLTNYVQYAPGHDFFACVHIVMIQDVNDESDCMDFTRWAAKNE